MAPSPPLKDDRASARYRWTLGLTAAAIQSLFYFGIGHLDIKRSTELLRTRFDDMIPFLPWTSWCYLPFYAGVFIMCISGIRSRRLFNRGLAAAGLVMLIGATGHLLIAAAYPRPLLTPPYANLSAAFMAWVQRIDPPGNVFPSLHVAQTSGLALILCRDRPRLGRVALLMGAMLAVSTLTTKQHFIADVVSGYALAFLARAVALRGMPPARTAEPAARRA